MTQDQINLLDACTSEEERRMAFLLIQILDEMVKLNEGLRSGDPKKKAKPGA
jgi:hypothetical protein